MPHIYVTVLGGLADRRMYALIFIYNFLWISTSLTSALNLKYCESILDCAVTVVLGSHAKVWTSAEVWLASVCWCGTCCQVIRNCYYILLDTLLDGTKYRQNLTPELSGRSVQFVCQWKKEYDFVVYCVLSMTASNVNNYLWSVVLSNIVIYPWSTQLRTVLQQQLLLQVYYSNQQWVSNRSKSDIAVRNRNHHTATWNLAFTPAKAGTWFSDPRGMQGWVDLGGGYIPK